MDNGTDDFDLTQEQKSRLLKLGRRSKSHEWIADGKQRKTDVLYDVLNCPLPLEPSVVNSLPSVVRGLSSRLYSLAGRPIGNLLQDSATDITTIVRIKEYAKEAGTSADSEEESEVFLAVYYAAIASALLFHNQKITQHSYSDLERFFYSFTKEKWVLNELRELFQKAQEYCQKEK
ncbi:hypothetical protein ACFL5Z_01905 [Planctomycetota bacterium]